MPASQDHITASTPMGATLVAGGATFRVWAPAARAVHVLGDFNGWRLDDASGLVARQDGTFAGFMPNVLDGHAYKLWIVGEGSEGWKRDPYARELTPNFPYSDGIVRDPASYRWQDAGFRPPPIDRLVVYQLHVGTFAGPNRGTRVARFLDVLERLEYLVDLGVNAVEPLPIVEYSTPRSMGYNGSDIFSPEMDYQLGPGDDLDAYLGRVNALFARKGLGPLRRAELAVPINQLKALVDLCHAYGLAVIFDVVYNHASGELRGPEHDQSIYFFDRQPRGDDNRSQYFTSQEHTGPVFAVWKREVRQFLIDNARFFVDEYHVDGFRYDQVSVIVQQNRSDGWPFCQHLTSTVRFTSPGAVQVAEYWDVDPYVVRRRDEGGAGFDAAWHDGLRTGIRSVIAQAAAGRDVALDWGPVARQLGAGGFPAAWQAVQYVESHDEVYRERNPRIAELAGGGHARTWYARSRSRVATGLVLTAPGIPMLFMGQEFLEDKRWSDDPAHHGGLIYWEGLDAGDTAMVDFHRFTRELIGLRHRHPALRGGGLAVLVEDGYHRVLAYQRWVEGVGRDVVVVASLNELTQYHYPVPFPAGGAWLEVFNSDVYDNWVNPIVAGNGGRVVVDGPPIGPRGASARIVIPANSVLVFARDAGDRG